MDLCAKCLGNAGELRGMTGESMGVGTKCLRNVGEFREMQWNVWVGAKCQGNAGECRRNLRQWVKCQRNAGKYREIPRERIESACKPPEECREMPGECKRVGGLPWGMQRNAARRMYGNSSKVTR